MSAGRWRGAFRKIGPRGVYDDALGEPSGPAVGQAAGSADEPAAGQAAGSAEEPAAGPRPGGWGLTIADCAFALATLAVAAAVLVATWSAAPASSLVAVVQNTEGFYQVLPLDVDATVTVESPYGTNVVEVARGKVRCSESDCSNQVCVDTGWVGSEGQMIVCLPHRLTVEVVADAADATPLV